MKKRNTAVVRRQIEFDEGQQNSPGSSQASEGSKTNRKRPIATLKADANNNSPKEDPVVPSKLRKIGASV